MSAETQDKLTVAGIDVGSSAVKVVVLEDGAGRRHPTNRVMVAADPSASAGATRRRSPRAVFEACLERGRPRRRDDLDYVATTGEGEIVAVPHRPLLRHDDARARRPVPRPGGARRSSTSARCTRGPSCMDERAKVLGYRMTSQCASGSGQFLENICRYLGITIDEIGRCRSRPTSPSGARRSAPCWPRPT